ncbi:sulfite exporter TauE/SafE family protein [Sinorhizobium meliloti]|uniref:sulfite exporter TauE/SafE family protein n=1 Tax=Rhizobium meliloti TaxID=382 RepID=UPI000FE00258|nr:sulfite exporter TauE/SafE family protein [Sinorhizobium meliloti]RVL90341.1 ABC transporter permease [Sinorhizobium meliloti]
MWLWAWIVDFQRDIYLAFADHIRDFSEGGSTSAFVAFLPMGIAFGSIHAMTPGHSKALLATYLAGSSASVWKALMTSVALSLTHVFMSVAIVLLSLPLVNIMFGGGGPGSSPILENFSRGLLGIIGLWMVWRALRSHAHSHGPREGIAFGFMAGLIPCPLTLFIMNFAVLHNVVAAGVLFAVSMMLGIALTLGVVAVASVLFRAQVGRSLKTRPKLIHNVSRILEVAAGLVLIAVAAAELSRS